MNTNCYQTQEYNITEWQTPHLWCFCFPS